MPSTGTQKPLSRQEFFELTFEAFSDAMKEKITLKDFEGRYKKVLEDFVLQKDYVHVALFGAGNLGSAILKYPGFTPSFDGI